MTTMTTTTKKTRRTYRPRKRRSGMKSKLAKSEFASLKEVYEFSTLSCGQAYNDVTLSLARFLRATQVAEMYQKYRITKVDYLFKPLTDTFAPASGGGSGIPVPYLYYLIDKVGANVNFSTQSQFTRAGAKPRRLDDKTIRVSYKPSVLVSVGDKIQDTNVFSRSIASPWLACNGNNNQSENWQPSSIDHLGIEWLVQGDPSVKYQVTITAHFQFCKPAIDVAVAVDGAPQSVSVDKLITDVDLPPTPPEAPPQE